MNLICTVIINSSLQVRCQYLDNLNNLLFSWREWPLWEIPRLKMRFYLCMFLNTICINIYTCGDISILKYSNRRSLINCFHSFLYVSFFVLVDNIFLSLFISLIDIAAVNIPPKINPKEKEKIFVGFICLTWNCNLFKSKI